MSGRSAARALAGGLGVVAVLVFSVIIAADRVRRPRPARREPRRRYATRHDSRWPPPTELVVALRLGDPVLQAGAVRDGDVILARGSRSTCAHSRAAPRDPPGQVRLRPPSRGCSRRGPTLAPRDRLHPPGPRRRRGRRPQRPVPRHRSGGRAAPRGAAPHLARRPPQPAHVRRPGERRRARARGYGRAGRHAVLVASPRAPARARPHRRLRRRARRCRPVGRFVAGQGALLGPITARVPFGGGYVVAVTRGGPVAVADVDRALARMRADGTMHRLARPWLGIDPARLAVAGCAATRPAAGHGRMALHGNVIQLSVRRHT